MVWGDVKPDNVMIRIESSQQVLVDFGGSYSEGWVDEELNETLERDLHGLEPHNRIHRSCRHETLTQIMYGRIRCAISRCSWKQGHDTGFLSFPALHLYPRIEYVKMVEKRVNPIRQPNYSK